VVGEKFGYALIAERLREIMHDARGRKAKKYCAVL
jgi:hypothetical protein